MSKLQDREQAGCYWAKHRSTGGGAVPLHAPSHSPSHTCDANSAEYHSPNGHQGCTKNSTRIYVPHSQPLVLCCRPLPLMALKLTGDVYIRGAGRCTCCPCTCTLHLLLYRINFLLLPFWEAAPPDRSRRGQQIITWSRTGQALSLKQVFHQAKRSSKQDASMMAAALTVGGPFVGCRTSTKRAPARLVCRAQAQGEANEHE